MESSQWIFLPQVLCVLGPWGLLCREDTVGFSSHCCAGGTGLHSRAEHVSLAEDTGDTQEGRRLQAGAGTTLGG